VTEKFIDDLYQDLDTKREAQRSHTQRANVAREQSRVARAPWWDAFVERLGQLIGAWNEKDPSAPRITFERKPGGEVTISHPNAFAELRLDGERVTGALRLGSGSERSGALIELKEDDRGGLVAMHKGAALASASAAAEEVIKPILIKAFGL
jgi:hypothetical protein